MPAALPPDFDPSLPLTGRRENFAREYPKDRNGLRAGLRAGYSEKSAAQEASRLLKDPKVLARIDYLRKDITSKHILTATETMEEVTRLATIDIADFMEVSPNGVAKVKDLAKLPPGAGKAIRKIKQKVTSTRRGITVTTEIELWNKDPMLALLAQHHNQLKPADQKPEGVEDRMKALADKLEKAHVSG